MIRAMTRHAMVIGLVGAVALSACGSDSNKADSTVAVSPGTDAGPGATDPVDDGTSLTISNKTFSDVTATAGTAFTISNKDGFDHTVTDRDGKFDVAIPGGSNATLTIDRSGTYEIFCRIHASMSGVITVV